MWLLLKRGCLRWDSCDSEVTASCASPIALMSEVVCCRVWRLVSVCRPHQQRRFCTGGQKKWRR